MPTISEALAHVLRTDLGVDASYRHAPKHVTPGEPVVLGSAVLKWYGLHVPDAPIPTAITELARSQAATIPGIGGLGFVVLHRCGAGFYFLIVSTWRHENELWETVWYKDGDGMAEFRLFPREETHKPVFCVWELAPVLHEKDAWARFLTSSRDDAAAAAWLADRYAGAA